MRLSDRKRIALALGAALALHALLLFLPASGKPPAKKAPPLRVDLVRRTPARPPQQQPALQSPLPQRGPIAAKSGRGQNGTAVPTPVSPPGPPPGAWTREWSEKEGVGPGLSLNLNGPLPGPASPGAAPKTREQQLAEEKSTVERRIEGWASDVKARQRAEAPDAYWGRVSKALEHGFAPGWELSERADEGRKPAFIENWERQAQAYGRTGNPFADTEPRRSLHDELPALTNELRGLDSVSLASAPQFGLNLGLVAALAGKSFSHRLVAVVRITQREDGQIFAVELFAGSGSAAYDRLALAQARSIGKLSLGAPPQGLQTLWAFETDFTQIPPVPLAGCQLDDFVPRNCWYPLQKTVRSRVRLQAIY
jgi:hypothetical protein